MAKKHKGKLELSWVDKGDIILTKFDENGKTYPASYFHGQVTDEELMPRELELVKTVGDPDSENMLIQGENLIALRSLEREFTGQIKFIYFDPPFNTGQDFEDYEDGLEHSTWLSVMENRLRIAEKLLRKDGVIFVHLDHNEVERCKLLMDEVFAKGSFLNLITMTTNDPSGFKATGSTIFSTANFLLVYSKNKGFSFKKIFIPKGYDKQYSKYLMNPEQHYSKWKWYPLSEKVAQHFNYETLDAMKKDLEKEECEQRIADFAISKAVHVFRLAVITGGARSKRIETIEKSREKPGKVFVHPNEDLEEFYILNGQQMLIYNKRIVDINGMRFPGELITDVWTDISWNGIANEGGVTLKEGKKPELLIKRCIDMVGNFSDKDYILDFFSGSGTTGAVAHKMGLKWIMIELREDMIKEKTLKRMKNVVAGDPTGISKEVGWKGGGGFKFYKLGEPLIIKHKEYPSIKIINPKYYNGPLVKVICKLEGFQHKKDDKVFYGVNKLGNKFAHITEQYISQGYIDFLKSKLVDNEELIVYCFNYDDKIDLPLNIIIKKLPGDLGKPYQLRLGV